MAINWQDPQYGLDPNSGADPNGVRIGAPSTLTNIVKNPDGSISYSYANGDTTVSRPDGSQSVTTNGLTENYNSDGTHAAPTKADGTPASQAEIDASNAKGGFGGITSYGDVARTAFESAKTASEKLNLEKYVTGKDAPGFDNNKINSTIDKTLGGTGTSFGGVDIPGTSGSGSGGSGGSLSDQVNAIADKAYGYANENRDFQLQGMNAANAALDPGKASYAGMYGPNGTLTGPGQGEQAFTQQGGNLLNQTEQSKALAAASPYLSGQSPGMQAFGNVAGQLSGPTLSGQSYGQYANTLGQSSAGENRYAQTAGQYDTNALAQQAGGLNAKLDQSTNLENNLGQIASNYSQPSASQSYFDSTKGQYADNKLNQSYAGLNSQYAAPTNLQGQLGSINSSYAAPSASQQTFQSQSGQLGGPGSLEQFAASDLNGTNPYYKQLQAQQSADIDASMNARGGFNSGAAIKAQAIGASNLAAQQYQQEGQLQGAAQTAMQSRLGQQQTAAGSSDTVRLAGLAGQVGALSQADQQRLAATNGQVALAGAASGMDLGYLQGGQQAAGASDSARYAGLAGLTNSLSTADAQRAANTNSQIGLAGQTANTNLNYLQGGQGAANSAGAASLARTQAGIGLAQGTDATNLAQNLGYTNAANAAGAGQVSQFSALGNMAQGQDAASQAQYMNYLSSAAAAQNQSQARQQQGYSDAMGIGAQQGAQTLAGYGKAGDQYASMISAGMGAQLNAAQLAAQQQQNQANNDLALGNLIINGYKAYATGGTSLVPGGIGASGGAQPTGGGAQEYIDRNTTGTNGAPIVP